MVKIRFMDGTETEEPDATNFGYTVNKFGDMTVVLVGEDESVMISVHNNVRSAWKVAAPAPTTAIDITSMPKKKNKS